MRQVKCKSGRWTHGRLVRSSNGFRYYKVSYDHARGDWVCNCPGGKFHGHCKHIDKVISEVC